MDVKSDFEIIEVGQYPPSEWASDFDSTSRKSGDAAPRSLPRRFIGGEPWSIRKVTVNLLAFSCFTLAAFGIGFVNNRQENARKHPPSQECDNHASMSKVEAQFDIDLVVVEGLSFTQAKLIDLVWDIVVGHGGRFLHGWIFYHVACKTITWILENSALPYWLLLDTLFRPDSLSSLRSLVASSCTGKQRRTTALKTLFLAFGAGHVLFFGTLWSVATGYKTPSLDGFTMPDKSWVVKTNETLRMCWSLDLERLGDLGTLGSLNETGGIILGPKFGSVFSSFEDLDGGSQRDGMWTAYSSRDESEAFRNVYAYARSKYTLSMFLHNITDQTVANRTRTNSTVDSVSWNETVTYGGAISVKGFEYVEYSDFGTTSPLMPNVIQGWQYLGEGQSSRADTEHMVWLNHSQSGPPAPDFPILGGLDPKPTFVREQFLRSKFELNPTIRWRPGVVPYTSKFWYDGASVSLSAPFLELGKNCNATWYNSVLGECLCYKGKPVGEDFRYNKFCTGGGQYIWGFSGSLAFISLIFEAAWCLVCLVLWVSSTERSKLIRCGRSATGDVRNILDLSEAMKKDLRDTTGWTNDSELRKALSGRQAVGFATKDACGTINDLRLVDVPDVRAPRTRLEMAS